MNQRDPIVEEVRSAREAYAARFGFDVRAICRDLRKRQADSGRRIVRAEPERERAESDPAANGA